MHKAPRIRCQTPQVVERNLDKREDGETSNLDGSGHNGLVDYSFPNVVREINDTK